jgi:futalosine hydrolase
LIDLLVCVSTELEGSLLRDHVPLLVTGIGSVNAAYSLTKFLSQQQVKRVIVCGIGGAYPQSGLAIGDVACAERECYGDLGADSPEGFLDMKGLGLPVQNELPLQIFPAECRVPFVTVNTCTGTDERAFAMHARTAGAVENMEGAAIAHVAGLFGIPVGEIRGVSNIAAKRDRAAWKIKDTAEAAQRALLRFVL